MDTFWETTWALLVAMPGPRSIMNSYARALSWVRAGYKRAASRDLAKTNDTPELLQPPLLFLNDTLGKPSFIKIKDFFKSLHIKPSRPPLPFIKSLFFFSYVFEQKKR